MDSWERSACELVIICERVVNTTISMRQAILDKSKSSSIMR